MEPLYHVDNAEFSATIFRRDYTQVTSPGGLWDTSRIIYRLYKGAMPYKSPKLHWTFPSGATVNFAHLGRDEECDTWQGSQIVLIGFDELTHFTEYMFFYMLSRNRSTCGVKPYVRATCNPDCDSWVAKFIEWWIDQDTGYPIKERSGKIRWMIRLNEIIHWYDTRVEAKKAAIESGIGEEEAETMPKSVTFIASTLQDNKILMKNDPSYLANLLAMPEVERERLLRGNWKIRPKAGSFFKRTQVRHMLDEVPHNLVAVCRGWDLAATEEDENGDAAYTAGVLMGKTSEGQFVILDVIRKQLNAGDVVTLIGMTIKIDKQKYGRKCPVRQRLPQDPGQAGKSQAKSFLKMFAGYDIQVIPESGDKATRAMPMAAQWQHGMFDVMTADWNEEYFNELESFPDGKWKDMVDAGSSAFDELTLGMKNIAGGIIYGHISDAYMKEDQSGNTFILSKDELNELKENQSLGQIYIGVTFGINGAGAAFVASTNTDYENMIALKSVLYTGDVADPEETVERCVDFIMSIQEEYGYVTGVFCTKGDQVMRRLLGNKLIDNSMGDISISSEPDRPIEDRINLVNKLAANNKILFVEDETESLTNALATARWDLKTQAGKMCRSEDNDFIVSSLNAFEYSFESSIQMFIAKFEQATAGGAGDFY